MGEKGKAYAIRYEQIQRGEPSTIGGKKKKAPRLLDFNQAKREKKGK